MRIHQAAQPLLISQEAHVPELIQLVRADRPLRCASEIPAQIIWRGSKERETGAGKRHLGRRGEDQGSVRVAGSLAKVEDIRDFVPVFRQMVNGIGVVPEQSEVWSTGLH